MGVVKFIFWASTPWQNMTDEQHIALCWMAAITGPWTFRSHTNKEIYGLVQCAIKVHVLIPSAFTARRGCAALLLQVYRLLVEKQLLVFLGGRQEKAEQRETVDEGSRLAKCEQVPKRRSLIIVITPDYYREFWAGFPVSLTHVCSLVSLPTEGIKRF